MNRFINCLPLYFSGNRGTYQCPHACILVALCFPGYRVKDEIYIITNRACGTICGSFYSFSKCKVRLCRFFVLSI